MGAKQLPPSWPNEVSETTLPRYYSTNFTCYESSGRTIAAIDAMDAVYVMVMYGMVTNGVLSRRRKWQLHVLLGKGATTAKQEKQQARNLIQEIHVVGKRTKAHGRDDNSNGNCEERSLMRASKMDKALQHGQQTKS